MSDEIKVNSELPQKLATLGQVKDALDKRDEKISNLTEDLTSKADKTALVKTDRKLDALWKLNQGISYEFQTEDVKKGKLPVEEYEMLYKEEYPEGK